MAFNAIKAAKRADEFSRTLSPVQRQDLEALAKSSGAPGTPKDAMMKALLLVATKEAKTGVPLKPAEAHSLAREALRSKVLFQAA